LAGKASIISNLVLGSRRKRCTKVACFSLARHVTNQLTTRPPALAVPSRSTPTTAPGVPVQRAARVSETSSDPLAPIKSKIASFALIHLVTTVTFKPYDPGALGIRGLEMLDKADQVPASKSLGMGASMTTNCFGRSPMSARLQRNGTKQPYE
jgi:hypothetical protein